MSGRAAAQALIERTVARAAWAVTKYPVGSYEGAASERGEIAELADLIVSLAGALEAALARERETG